MTRKRVDLLLVERGLVESRARAQAEIAAGHVWSAGRLVRRASEAMALDAPLVLSAGANPYVSRGGLKLAFGLDHFGIDARGCVALDAGASTGGFTDVLLQRGARQVIAVDVGRGQLHRKLRSDPRVVFFEGTDVRDLKRTSLPALPDLIAVDLSFIGLHKVLSTLLDLAAERATLVALVKPQFEVGRAHIGKGGIVRDEEARKRAVESVRASLIGYDGWHAMEAVQCPVKGGDGNTEYFLAARREGIF